jgi:PAS domain S-box-containing protein
LQNDVQSLLLQNRLLTEEVKRRVDQLYAINTVAATVSGSLDLDKTLTTALQAVLNVVGAEAGGISLIDERAGEVVLRAQQGWPHNFIDPPMRIPLGLGMSGEVIATNDVVVDNHLDGTEPLAVPRFHEEKFRSIVMAPMRARNKIIGILSIMSSQYNAFSDEIVNVLRAVADTVGVAIDNARLYETTVEHESRLNAIFQASADGMIATDANGRMSMINHAAEVIFNVDAQTLIGTPLREAPIHSRVRESLLRALSSHTAENQSFQVTLGNARALSIIVSSVYTQSQVEQDRRNDGWVIVLRDVSHLREAEIRRAEFMRAAAHDMKNPLGVTLSGLQMLNDYFAEDDPTALEIIRLAMNGVQRLQTLINDLLQLEQIENKFGVTKRAFKIDELMRECVDEVMPLLLEKNLEHQLEVSSNLAPVLGDRGWIKRALLNYIDNAIKYTQPGGRLKVKAFTSDRLLHVEVIDNGPGIPTEAQARLFERFYRASADERIQGTGLGLAIVKSVAEAHGGGVYVRSQPGGGSAFGLTLALD